MAARRGQACRMAVDLLADVCPHLVPQSGKLQTLEQLLTIPRIILPLLGEYTDSGYRTPKDRITYSLRSNARYQLIVLACAAAGGIYIFLQNGFAGGSVKSLVMAWVHISGGLGQKNADRTTDWPTAGA